MYSYTQISTFVPLFIIIPGLYILVVLISNFLPNLLLLHTFQEA